MWSGPKSPPPPPILWTLPFNKADIGRDPVKGGDILGKKSERNTQTNSHKSAIILLLCALYY